MALLNIIKLFLLWMQVLRYVWIRNKDGM